MESTKKKPLIITAVTIFLLSLAGIAFAYWTNSGTGTGSATTGNNAPISISQTSTLDPLAPGVDAQNLTFNFDNENDGPVYVNEVIVAIESVTKDSVPVEGCSADDYTIAGSPMSIKKDIAKGTEAAVGTFPTVEFNNTAANQDACKGATVNFSYTITP